MRYIDESLAPGEVILQRGQWPKVFWIGAWAALLLLGIILVGIFLFLRSWIIMSTTDFAVTNRRVILKTGWLNRRTQELAVESVEGVILDQSLLAAAIRLRPRRGDWHRRRRDPLSSDGASGSFPPFDRGGARRKLSGAFGAWRS
jgi:hypothetical protein